MNQGFAKDRLCLNNQTALSMLTDFLRNAVD